MPMTLEGNCRCGAVSFTLASHTPVPYQRCYCRICCKTQGGGGYAINLGGIADSLDVKGRDAMAVYKAEIEDGGVCHVSSGQRHFCRHCSSGLWLFDPTWPELIHPFASAIDTDLPVPREQTHIMLAYKLNWVEPQLKPGDVCFDQYPDESLADWHRSRGLWVE
ncbi:GFA family protein [Acuticoccus sediminis]|uniref:GFA family protein n=1 Tax=Acuticoccus sediminis TaxID=2184697 RepID=UPI001CFDDA8F|nr:GFA family protein [Acuticoccus sediminis]